MTSRLQTQARRRLYKHCVPKNVTTLCRYNSNLHESILTILAQLLRRK